MIHHTGPLVSWRVGLCLLMALLSRVATADVMPLIKVSADRSHFELESSGDRFVVWGVNYDHDQTGRLLDEYWIDEWPKVVEDFGEIKQLGANCVRIHLQLGKFLHSPQEPNQAALAQLSKLVQLAETTGLYLDITGLACYHKQNIPDWLDQLSEQDRWKAQAVFWESVAKTCRHSPAVFCYDLMNEPILPGKKPTTEWLGGKLDGKFFVQRIALDLRGRERAEVAKAWVDQMVDAIRKHDQRHLVTVGVIPWVYVFGGGKPLFHSAAVGERLDFVAVHFYPKKGEVQNAITALRAYQIGKPLIVEEMFPLACSQDELAEFVDQSAEFVDGWVSFYWGATAADLHAKKDRTIADAITAKWLDRFRAMSIERTTTEQK
ncbi:cellulase family glycosylhydrolase [Planctomycetes bacterium K23_9]|uniref:Cellulase (Glycosyl hydrolase family 5) n=1 Tax=Stieleria marina TaxID=1930275 RepID=A0A517NX82_9BACT|nr:Cellulase (glycosyl hydrolase family 5) [Planctomycetes bacterium K23_9]